MARLLPLCTASASTAARTARPGRARVSLSLLVIGSLGVLTACGGSDDTADQAESNDEVTSDQAEDVDESAAADGGEFFDPATVEACLEDAGFEMVRDTEVLSEQQVADQLTAFGQTADLGFDAATSGFAGGVSFFETPDQAAERGQKLADVAKAQRVIGNALVNVAAGSDFDDAVAAAEVCLGE